MVRLLICGTLATVDRAPSRESAKQIKSAAVVASVGLINLRFMGCKEIASAISFLEVHRIHEAVYLLLQFGIRV
jgi:hypothetical protein